MSKTANFINKAKSVHGDKYDYSSSIYESDKVKINIICPNHGAFSQRPSSHLSGCGCKKCVYELYSKQKKYNTQIFVEKAKKIHGEKYDYSLAKYKGSKNKVKILCKEHGSFYQEAASHLRGGGCKKCADKKSSKKQMISKENFIKKCIKIHGDVYNYKKVTLNKGVYSRIVIFCKKHGEFEQLALNHMTKTGCPECNGGKKLKFKEFTEKSKEKHGDKYYYKNVEYKNNYTYVKVKCQKHGFFKQLPSNHMAGNGCPTCKESKGEKRVRIFLEKKQLKYIRQHSFEECKHKKKLYFDYYIPEQNLLIEYDGEQHFKPINIFGGKKGLIETQKRDKIKSKYAKDNNIKLIRIPYTEFNNIENILNKLLTKELKVKS